MVTFPVHNPVEEILATSGDASIVRVNGIRELRLGKSVYSTDSISETARYSLLLPYVRGNVIEVGLGLGVLNALLHQQSVSQVVSIELVQAFADLFNELNSPDHQTVYVGNAFDMVNSITVDFDLMLLDIDYTQNQTHYNRMKQFVIAMYSHLSSGADVLIPHIADDFTDDITSAAIASEKFSPSIVEHASGRITRPEWIRLTKL